MPYIRVFQRRTLIVEQRGGNLTRFGTKAEFQDTLFIIGVLCGGWSGGEERLM